MTGIRDCQIQALSTANKYLKRLMIRGFLENGMSTVAVSHYIGCAIHTVKRWEDRNDIYDLPRSGRPLIYGEDRQLKVIGFYCQSQPLPECGRWTLRMAAAYLNAHSERTDLAVSKSTIFRILQSHNLKPHRSKYFLHISDPDFFPKMEHIVALYLNPPKNLFCFDECPGIQILQRLVPDLRTDEMKIRLEEFEYIRHGTTDLFACLEVGTGKVFSECHACHDAKTLVEFMEKHFLTIPENESTHYILDNLNTHCCYEICVLVAKHSAIDCPPEKELDTMKKRRNWLSGEEKRIVFHFTPFHGSWLNMIEIWFGIIGAKCLNESFASPDEMRDAIMAFTNELWNNLMAHPFNWKYDGEGLHEKAVARFTQNLKSKNVVKMELRVLTKQLCLMKNLFCQYRNLISEKCWNDFWKSFPNKISDFKRIIEDEPGAQRKKKALIALEELTSIFLEENGIERNLAA